MSTVPAQAGKWPQARQPQGSACGLPTVTANYPESGFYPPVRSTQYMELGTKPIEPPLEVYIVCVKWTGRMVHLLWYEGDTFGEVVESDNRIVTFESREEVYDFAVESGMIACQNDVEMYDFDHIATWTQNPSAADIRPKFFLNCWNLLDDIRASIDQPDTSDASPEDESQAHAYSALWLCINAADEAGHEIRPELYFTDNNVQALRLALANGLLMFATNL